MKYLSYDTILWETSALARTSVFLHLIDMLGPQHTFVLNIGCHKFDPVKHLFMLFTPKIHRPRLSPLALKCKSVPSPGPFPPQVRRHF